MKKRNPYINDRDILDSALEHGWGNTADAKAKEKAYNREYYQRHKEEILRKARQAGEGIQRTFNNARNELSTATSNARVQSSNKLSRNDIERYRQANVMNDRLLGEAKNRSGRADVNERQLRSKRDRLRNASDSNYAKAESEFKRSRELNNDSRTTGYAKEAKNAAIDYQRKGKTYGDMATTAAGEHLESLREKDRAAKNQSRMANRRAASGAAYNEAAKAERADDWGMYDKRFDSKLARTAQNAYSKIRNPKEMARRAGESAKNAVNNTKAYIDNAMGKNGRRGSGVGQEAADKLRKQSKEQSARAQRFLNSARANVKSSNSSYRQYQDLEANPNTRGYAPQAYDNAYRDAYKAIDYGTKSEKAARRASSSAAAANAASNAANRPGYDTRYDSSIVRGAQNAKAKTKGALTKAQKEAQKARDEAKKRMKKWFNR